MTVMMQKAYCPTLLGMAVRLLDVLYNKRFLLQINHIIHNSLIRSNKVETINFLKFRSRTE